MLGSEWHPHPSLTSARAHGDEPWDVLQDGRILCRREVTLGSGKALQMGFAWHDPDVDGPLYLWFSPEACVRALRDAVLLT